MSAPATAVPAESEAFRPPPSTYLWTADGRIRPLVPPAPETAARRDES